jgi:hypothetical protein
MTVHQCPKCELRFDWKTELDDHCRQDHPEFHHDYPAQVVPPPAPEQRPHPAAPPAEPYHMNASAFFAWLRPDHERERAAHRPAQEPPPSERNPG